MALMPMFCGRVEDMMGGVCVMDRGGEVCDRRYKTSEESEKSSVSSKLSDTVLPSCRSLGGVERGSLEQYQAN